MAQCYRHLTAIWCQVQAEVSSGRAHQTSAGDPGQSGEATGCLQGTVRDRTLGWPGAGRGQGRQYPQDTGRRSLPVAMPLALSDALLMLLLPWCSTDALLMCFALRVSLRCLSFYVVVVDVTMVLHGCVFPLDACLFVVVVGTLRGFPLYLLMFCLH